ncbi:MAG: ATP-dependent sacrificial sulfur transferase LarE [Clostridiales bacterium]|jgi:uncharacterized protein|nr:ATP-dependent sacrificial sulfur transferase LarE [Clostridiales bacterium]
MNDRTIDEKRSALIRNLSGMGAVCVAFSGGVDSTYLLASAKEALGGEVLAVTARSPAFPEREVSAAAALCRQFGVPHEIIETDELSEPGFADNPANRCYLCKSALFRRVRDAAARHGITMIAEGSNVDDLGDYRPGLGAVAELGIRSPLRAAGLTKAEIRELSRREGLSTWDKPSFACLFSRFPHGERMTKEKLEMIGRSEQYLLDLGFRQTRVRVHGDLARVEVGADELDRLFDPETRAAVREALLGIGFAYVTADLGGYRTGSMNPGYIK